jgi:hypothetical protein
VAVYDALPPEATSASGMAPKPKKKAKKVAKATRRIPSQSNMPPDQTGNPMGPIMYADVPVLSKRQKAAVPTKRQKAAAVPAKQQAKLAENKKATGFAKNAQAIAKKQGIPKDRASAILAAGARNASSAAKKANPALKRVKGAAKK